jgi:Fur family transcriptional regulator, ferric uptake regulator
VFSIPMERQINTRQKTAIRDAFIEADRPLSPDEVLAGAQRHHPTLGKATVYRNIQSLVDEGWLQAVEVPGDSPRYEVAGKEHHHHFQCNQYKKLYELQGCIPSFKMKVPRGFSTTGHEFFLYGLCSQCNH